MKSSELTVEKRYAEIAKYYFKPKSIWLYISKSVNDEFKASSSTYTVKKNTIIYSEGTYPKGLYIIKKGIAKLYFIDNLGQEQIIYMLTKNDIFGHRSILSKDNSLIYITALEDCEIELIERDVFMACLQKSIKLNEFFLNYYGKEFRLLLHKISVFSLKPVIERIALTLLVLNQKFNTDEGKEDVLLFSKKDIANFAGTIIETLSRQLKILSDAGAIRINGKKIEILDFDILYEKANI